MAVNPCPPPKPTSQKDWSGAVLMSMYPPSFYQKKDFSFAQPLHYHKSEPCKQLDHLADAGFMHTKLVSSQIFWLNILCLSGLWVSSICPFTRQGRPSLINTSLVLICFPNVIHVIQCKFYKVDLRHSDKIKILNNQGY